MSISDISPQAIAIFGIVLATVGWLWTTKRARSLSRKQHTFNALLQSSFNEKYQNAHVAVRPFVRGKKKFDWSATSNTELKDKFTFLLNHYEFLAAGVRNGDISEQLLKDSQKGVISSLFSYCELYIESLRTDRKKQALFEHLEWLYMRWDGQPPNLIQRTCEWILSKPIYHNHYKWFFWAPILVLIGMTIEGFLISYWIHSPPSLPPPP